MASDDEKGPISLGEKPSENGYSDPEKHEGEVKTVHLKRKLQSRHLQMIGKTALTHSEVSIIDLSL